MADKVQEVKIDSVQSATWATEATLRKLLNESNTTRGVIEKYLSKLEDWDEAQLAEARSFAKKSQQGVDRTVTAYDLGAESINRGLQGLGTNLSGSFGQIVKGLGVLSSTSGIGNLSNASTLAASALATTTGNLSGFAKYISIAGVELLGFVGGVVAIAHMVDELNDNFSKLYDSGINVAGGLNGLVDMSKYLELTTGEAAKVLTQYSSAITILGTQRTAQLIKEFKNITKTGSIFAYNLEQTAEAVLEYAEIVRSTGGLSNESVVDLAKGAKKFNEEISITSQITGQSRKEIQKGLKTSKDRMAAEAALPDAMRKNLPVLKAQFAALGESGGTLMKNLEDYVQMGAYGLDANLRNFLAQSGLMGTFDELASNMASGGTDVRGTLESFASRIANTDKQTLEWYNTLSKSSGPVGDMARQFMTLYADSKNQVEATKKEIEQAKEYMKTHKQITSLEEAREKLRQKRQAEQEATDQRTQQVQNTLESAGKQLTLVFQKLVVNVLEPLLPLLNGLGDVVIWLSERFKDVIDDLRFVGKVVYSIIHPFETVSNALSKFSDYMMDSVAGYKTVYDNLSSIITGVSSVFQKLLSPLNSMIKWFSPAKEEKPEEKTEAGVPIPVKSRTMSEELTDLALEAGGGLLAAKFLKNKFLSKKAAAPVAETVTPEAAQIAQQAASVSESITKAKTSLGDSISALSGGIKNTMSSLASGIKDSVSSLAQAVSNVFGSLTKGLGTGLINIAEGAGGALKALGMALASLGPEAGPIALGSAAVGAAIAAIGAGIAGATWLMGAALPKLSEGINSFTALDSAKLSEVGASFEKLGIGLLKLGGGEMFSAIGGFTSWMSSWVKADPLSQLKQFSALSSEVPALNAVGDALNKFAEGYRNLSESLKESAGSIPGSLDKLKNLSVPEKLSPTTLKFNQSTNSPLPSPAESINLSNTIKDIQRLNEQSKNERSLTADTGAVTTGSIPGQPDLTSRTMQFYEESKFNNRTTQEVLTQIKMSLDALNNSINNQTSSLSRSIVKASPVIS